MLNAHTATYEFMDRQGGPAGTETMTVERRPDGWLVTSRLRLSSPDPLSTEIEWQLLPDASTRVLDIWSTDAWGEEYHLEAAVTGNGLLCTRHAPSGPTQIEMGWGPRVELDHVSAAFTAVMLARWDRKREPEREVTSVCVCAEDLLPEPLDLALRAASPEVVERLVPSTGARARITLRGGLVEGYEGLFRRAGLQTAPERPTK